MDRGKGQVPLPRNTGKNKCFQGYFSGGAAIQQSVFLIPNEKQGGQSGTVALVRDLPQICGQDAHAKNVSHRCPGLPPGGHPECGRIEDTPPRNKVAMGVKSLQLNAHLKIGGVGKGNPHISLGCQKGGEKPLYSAADLKASGLGIQKGNGTDEE